MPLKKTVGDIELSRGPLMGGSNGEHGLNRGRLNDRHEGFTEVDAGTLGKAPNDPPSFIPLKVTIWVELVLENPFPRDDVGTRRAINQPPGTIGLKRAEFMFHRSILVGIAQSHANGGLKGRDWTSWRGCRVCGEHISGIRLVHTSPCTSDHRMCRHGGRDAERWRVGCCGQRRRRDDRGRSTPEGR